MSRSGPGGSPKGRSAAKEARSALTRPAERRLALGFLVHADTENHMAVWTDVRHRSQWFWRVRIEKCSLSFRGFESLKFESVDPLFAV